MCGLKLMVLRVHGGFGFGKRNVDEMILEFADALHYYYYYFTCTSKKIHDQISGITRNSGAPGPGQNVWSEIDGFEGVHGGFGFGKRNVDDEMILEFADALNLAVLNTRYIRRGDCSHMSPANAGLRLITSIMFRKSEKMIRDVNMVKVECIKQHSLLI